MYSFTKPIEGKGEEEKNGTNARLFAEVKRYCVFGLHESYNSEEMLARLDEANFKYFTYESSMVRQEVSLEDQLSEATKYLGDGGDHDVGIEVDLDSIIGMPSSAKTPIGISAETAANIVHTCTSTLSSNVRYLHLSEGAPRWASTHEEGARIVGKTVAMLAATYIKARMRHFRKQKS